MHLPVASAGFRMAEKLQLSVSLANPLRKPLSRGWTMDALQASEKPPELNGAHLWSGSGWEVYTLGDPTDLIDD